jgi:hypothetical protein
MKNKNLKSLLAQKLVQQKSTELADVHVLNNEELIYAMGGAAAGGPCPVLTSCGTYSTCGVKVGQANK